MTGDTRQLLDAHMDERRRELRLTWDQVATLAKIHRETLRQIRRGNSELRPLTKAGIETALQWKSGSIERILAGDEPLPLAQPTGPAQDDPDRLDRLYREWKEDDERRPVLEAFLESWRGRDAG